MATHTNKSAAARPVSVEEQDNDRPCLDCLRQQKIDTALAVMSMFLEASKPTYISEQTTGEVHGLERVLKPKEEATYMASLDWLERYLDSPG